MARWQPLMLSGPAPWAREWSRCASESSHGAAPSATPLSSWRGQAGSPGARFPTNQRCCCGAEPKREESPEACVEKSRALAVTVKRTREDREFMALRCSQSPSVKVVTSRSA